MPIALVHDWLNQIGGAEDVLETLVAMYPGAPIYTSIYWPEKMPAQYRQWIWDDKKDITFYLRLVSELLTDDDYTGV